MRNFWILVAAMGLVACSDDAPTLGGGFSKADAASQGGMNEEGEDLCQLEEWYGDGVCDAFCPVADEDCAQSACSSNPDCANGERCDDGVCVSDIDLVCSDSTPCPEGFLCTWPLDGACGNDARQGVCAEVPTECPNELAPVCGCDGADFANPCQAAREGVSVAYEGECVATCATHEDCGTDSFCNDAGACEPVPTCDSNEGCPTEFFCKSEIEDACTSAQGVCELRPVDCPEIITPVCGCDDNEYTNSCFAMAAGVNYVEGECQTTCDPDQDDVCAEGEFCIDGVCQAPVTCGGLLGGTCEEGQYCYILAQDSCGEADQTGTCAQIPAVCPKDFAPVCGCDGQTYGNECMAAAAGVSVRSEGACSKSCVQSADCAQGESCVNGSCEGTTNGCGARNGDTCAITEWCSYGGPTGVCGQADQPGTCEPRPDACLAVFDPVCGCDNQTHSNACAAHAAGVDVLHDGACGTTM